MKAYLVFYNAYRSGSAKKHSAFYRIEKEIDNADQYAHMVGDIQRHAVANGHANSVEDVVIDSVTLLNPTGAEVAEVEAQQRDTVLAEPQLAELRSLILTIKNTLADTTIRPADKVKRIKDLTEPY